MVSPKKIWAALVALLLSAGVTCAQYPGATTPDPRIVTEVPVCGTGLWACNAGYNDLNAFGARSLRSTPLIDTTKKNLVLIIAGQSNVGSEAPTAYSPTNGSAIDDLNLYDGGIYPWADPPLGATWSYQSLGGSGTTCAALQSCGNIGARIADLFISGDGTIPANTFNRVIIAPVAVGGTAIAQWDTSGSVFNRICVALRRLNDHGITPSVTNVTFAIVWGQGENDHGTTTLAYESALSDIQAKAVSCGFSGRFFVNEQTWLCTGVGSNSTDSNVEAAQIGIVDNVKFWAGFNADSLGASDRRSDCGGAAGTHFNDTGIAAFATGIAHAMHASGAPF
jgi:hypothetical protein